MVIAYIKRVIWSIVFVAVVIGFVYYYSFIFSRTVKGRIENVARVTEVTALIGTRSLTEDQLYSFSVSIRQPNGEMLTATSEDRQWAVAKSGLCVEAKYYPYPPWQLDKAGTYFNARLLALADCNSQAARDMGIDPASFAALAAPGPSDPGILPNGPGQAPPPLNNQTGPANQQ